MTLTSFTWQIWGASFSKYKTTMCKKEQSMPDSFGG